MMMGIAYALLATPVFKANALLQVEKKTSGTALLGDMADVLGGEQADAAAEIELLTSRMVLGRTVQELHLDTVVTPDFFPLVGRGVSRLMGQPYPRMAISRFEVASELIGTSFTLILTGENRFTLEVEGRVLEGQVGKLLQNEEQNTTIFFSLI
jgi:tyrosine-protein kinase Etk/Wzc